MPNSTAASQLTVEGTATLAGLVMKVLVESVVASIGSLTRRHLVVALTPVCAVAGATPHTKAVRSAPARKRGQQRPPIDYCPMNFQQI